MKSHEYAFYSDNSDGRYPVYRLISLFTGLLTGVIAWLLYLVLDHFQVAGLPLVKLVFFVGSTLGVLTSYGQFVKYFDRKAWRGTIGNLIFWFASSERPPDIQGKYLCSFTWYDDDATDPTEKQGREQAVVTIAQSWERISFVFEPPQRPRFTNRRSTSNMARMDVSLKSDQLDFAYSYEYRETEERPGTTQVQYNVIRGTSRLQFKMVDGKWKATGEYWSDDRGAGTMALEQQL